MTPISFAAASVGGSSTRTIVGQLDTGAADFVYLPIEIPAGVRQIDVSYSYDKPSVSSGAVGNSCDIGIFDERGAKLGGDGFRGWSGGFRSSFFINGGNATPGYLPGRISTGTWHIVLGPYQVAPQGLNYRVRVTLTFGATLPPFMPNYPPQQIAARPRAWYRGDCHLHTVYSDGTRTPWEVAAGARAAGLDFIVTTDHNTSSSHGLWGPLSGPDLLIITGEEVTTRTGHYLAIGLPPGQWIDWRYRSRDGHFDEFAHQIHRLGGLVVPAHPHCPFIACSWKFGYDLADAVEVWNGPWTADDESAVAMWDSMLVASVRDQARWLPAVGNSDAHSESQVIGLPQTVALASGLGRADVLAAISSGHSWIAESSAVSLSFTVNTAGRTAQIGERLDPAPNEPAHAVVAVDGVPNGVVRFITDQGQVHQTALDASGAGTASWTAPASLAAYVRVEVRHVTPAGTPGTGAGHQTKLPIGPMAAMTNPIFLVGRSSSSSP